MPARWRSSSPIAPGGSDGRCGSAPRCPSSTSPRAPALSPPAWLDAYFAGQPLRFAFPRHLRDWFDLSPAQLAVYRALRKIRFGETRSYDEIARSTGLHPRQIGWLTAANHLAIMVPCHRVVGKDGALVGYSGGLEAKRWLLAHESRKAGVMLR